VTVAVHQVVVCGGRDFVPSDGDAVVLSVWLAARVPLVLHHGDARGADRWAAGVAARVPGVTVIAHPAQWAEHGRSAGPRRNAAMLTVARAAAAAWGRLPELLAYPGGRGTDDMVDKARRAGIPVVAVLALTAPVPTPTITG